VERRLHPWNRDFEWADHTEPFRRVTPGQAAQFDELGYFVMEDVFDLDTLDELGAALAPGDDAVRSLLEGVDGHRLGVAGLDSQIVTPHAVTRSDVARAFCARPELTDVCADLIGPDVRLYWEQSVYKQPNGSEPVLWHQDNGYTYVEPQAYLTCWIAIDDATIDNGCIHVMPGAHRNGTLEHKNTPVGMECWGDFATAEAVPIRAGSMAVFTSLTPHATQVNTTDRVRRAYIVQYIPDGAEALTGPVDSPTRTLQNDPNRQFPVLTNGCITILAS
jgi:phytanoyl-CoA hydroxylase